MGTYLPWFSRGRLPRAIAGAGVSLVVGVAASAALAAPAQATTVTLFHDTFTPQQPGWSFTPSNPRWSGFLGPLGNSSPYNTNQVTLTLTATQPHSATLSFDLLTFHSLDNANTGCCTDTMSLAVNGALAVQGYFGFIAADGLGSNPAGATMTPRRAADEYDVYTENPDRWAGAYPNTSRTVTVPVSLAAGPNTFTWSYTGLQGFDDEAWGLDNVTVVGTALDTTAPVVACDPASGAWSPGNVEIHCTATDPGSGLANPADASFTLVTTVAEGQEDSDAATGSREVCDVAGNCATAGPVTGNRVDRRAPDIAVDAPTATTYLLNAPVAADYACADGGSGVAHCTGTVPGGQMIDTSTVGTHLFTVAAQDQVGNQASPRSVAYTVDYNLCSLTKATPARQPGSTIPVKLYLCDSVGADVSTPAIQVVARDVVRSGDPTQVMPAADSGNANPRGVFRYDPTLGPAGGYIFNLSTKGLSAGDWSLRFSVAGSDTTYQVTVTVR